MDKDQEIRELRAKLEHEATINKLLRERESLQGNEGMKMLDMAFIAGIAFLVGYIIS